jgi:DNA-binding MarR family transcriptional regulator
MPFEECICFQLGRSLRQVTKAYRNKIAEYNFTHGQFFLIVAIMEEEGLLPSELADKTAQDRAAVTGVLDRLEKEGWVERRNDVKDRRSLKIFMTPKAKEHRDDILELFEKINRQYLDRFTLAEWSQMQDFLNRLEQ